MGPGRRWKQQPSPLQRRLLLAPLELVTLPQCLACLLWPSLSLLTTSPRTTFQLLVAGSPFVPSFQLDTTLENMLSYLSLAPHLLLRPFLPSSHLSSWFPRNVALGRSQLEWNRGRERMAVPLTLCHCLLTLSRTGHTRGRTAETLPTWGACGSSHQGTCPVPSCTLLSFPFLSPLAGFHHTPRAGGGEVCEGGSNHSPLFLASS